MLPVFPFVGLLVKTNLRHFFTTHQPCYVAQLMYVNGVYIFTMFVTLLLPLVNCFEISLNVFSSNVHKTVVLYKAVQSFCSDIVAQNVNVISLPTCKVLCFKKNHCFTSQMLETSPFAVTPSTKLHSPSILSPLSSSLSSLSLLSSSSSIPTSPSSSLSSSSSSSPLSINPPSPSSSSVSFYISLISEVRVSPSYLNSSVFF